MSSRLTQVICPPAAIVTLSGPKVKLSMVTVALEGAFAAHAESVAISPKAAAAPASAEGPLSTRSGLGQRMVGDRERAGLACEHDIGCAEQLAQAPRVYL